MQIHLRSLAERLLREGTVSVPDLQGIDLNELIHELHVYHAELQIQHSELEAAQAEAERSRNEYAQLFHYAPVSILFVDQRGVIKEANQAAARQLGATHQGLRGKPLSLFLPASEHPRFFHSLRAVLRQQERLEFQTQCVRLGGDRFPAMCTMAWWPMSEIAHPMVSLSFHDLTETQRAEQALQKQAELQRQTTARIESLVNALPAHIAMLDAQGNIVAVNEAWKRFSCDNGLKVDNYCIGYNYLNVCASATGDNCEEAAEAAEAVAGIRAVLAGEVPEFVTEYPCHSPQEQRWFRLMVTPVLIDGTSRGAVVMHLNVTERKLAEAEKQRLIVDLNERVKELRGLHTAALLLRESLPTQEVLSKIAAMLPGTLRFGHLAAARVCFGAECQATPNFCDTPWKLETTFTTAEGTLGRIEVVYLDSHSSSDPNLFLPEERRLLDSLAEMLRAYFDRQQATWRLQAQEEQFRLLFENNPHPMWVYDLETLQILAVNDTAVEQYGYSREDFLARTMADLEVNQPRATLDSPQTTRPTDHQDGIHQHRLKDGRIIWTEVSSRLIEFAGRSARLVLALDVTSRLQAEQALRVSEERFCLLAKATNDAIWDWDILANNLWWNEGLQTLFGYYLDEFSPTIEAWERCIHPDDRERIVSGVYRAIEDGSTYWSEEYRFLCKDGKYAYVLDRGYIIRDQSGKAVRMIGGMTDLTEKKNLEMRLIQSQKMEAIGHLAGGVAHDFNNLLTVINGYCEILMTMMPENDRKRHMLAQVRDAGEHAANLTRQLLAFSRKQVLTPQVIDLNATVSNLQKMLQRLIGEDIRLTTVLHPGLKRVKVDPGQLEQVLLNLAVNARDAMPTGGQLLIETSNVQIGPQGVSEHPDVPPGDYVAVKVSDTGCGMPPEIQARIFEPFFTTKEVGKGTGLGLATVFGIVKQSNGYIEVNSKVGVGTQFQILFPAVQDKPRQPARLQSPVARGSETILLVEDEPNVRQIARMSLEAQGYRVLEAGSGSEAIDLFETTEEPIHLVITDVIMPEMSGHELSERLRQRNPEVKVLYMSGYTDDAIVRHGVIEEKERFLQKPFSPATLAHKVRSILENP